jgi:flagellar M-ring protein FliF
MDQLKNLFATLTMAQKAGLAAAVLLVAVGIPLFSHWQHESSFKPLFTGMAPEDAGAIVAKLKETGTEHKLAENGTSVLVPADKVDEVRLELAGEGLPKTGRIGFELFDKTNISLTDFGEHVNYRRAVEGELEKTIKSINGIEDARVHVTFPKDSVFLDAREAAKASVLVHVKPGVHLAPQNVVAISNLVASAVESLSPDAVSVVDMQGNLLSRVRRPSSDPTDAAENSLDYKHQVEKDLTSKVEATLEPLLGEGKFRVGVTVDCDFSTSDQTDEVYDPTRSVMSTSQKTEDLSQGAAMAGVPGTASNLPRSQIRSQAAGGAPGGSSVSRRTESQAFQTSRTVREIKTPRGVVKKVSAALLIDQDVEWQGKGNQRKRVLIPPSAEKMKAIHDVVAGVLGITTDRGDQLVIETLPFEQTRNAEDTTLETAKPLTPGKLTLKDLIADKKILIGAAAGLLFVILLVGFLLRKPKAAAMTAQLAEKPVIVAGKPDQVVVGAELAAGAKQVEGSETTSGAENAMKELEDSMPSLRLPEMTNHTKALVDHLRKSISKDPEAAANIIRTWMEEA